MEDYFLSTFQTDDDEICPYTELSFFWIFEGFIIRNQLNIDEAKLGETLGILQLATTIHLELEAFIKKFPKCLLLRTFQEPDVIKDFFKKVLF